MAGLFVGKAVVQRMSVQTFHLLIDGLPFCSGLSLLGRHALRRLALGITRQRRAHAVDDELHGERGQQHAEQA